MTEYPGVFSKALKDPRLEVAADVIIREVYEEGLQMKNRSWYRAGQAIEQLGDERGAAVLNEAADFLTENGVVWLLDLWESIEQARIGVESPGSGWISRFD